MITQLLSVLLVGNSVSGTVSFIDPRTLKNLGSVDVIPDISERLKEINDDPARAAIYRELKKGQVIKFEPEGAHGDRFIDDLFTSPDGSTLYVSRSNLADVAAFDLRSAGHPMIWRTRVGTIKADHAALSPDGSRIVVSTGLDDQADVIDTSDGKIVGSFRTGRFAHQNDFSSDGQKIYNTSIGDVSLPYSLKAFKGPHLLTVADARSLRVERTYAFSDGIRPNVISADGSVMYAQLSYLNGVIKYDLARGKEVGRAEEPLSPFARTNYPNPDDYPHNSAHHGLALSGDGARLCDLGTIDNTVSIRSSQDLSAKSTTPVGMIPYWATTSPDGKTCFVSLSGADQVVAIRYATGEVQARIPVGRFPQRTRIGRIISPPIEAAGSR